MMGIWRGGREKNGEGNIVVVGDRLWSGRKK
jgi:hypothetical protein